MSKLKSTLLHGLLFASLLAFPVVGFSAQPAQNNDAQFSQQEVAQRFRFGVYYGRPYYYRPYYYYYPYRPYYYRNYHYPYYNRPYYRW